MSLKEGHNQALKSESEKSDSKVYKNSQEHLADELMKLDALLHLQVLRARNLHPYKKFDEFTGLYIKEEDVDRALGKDLKNKNGASPSVKESEITTLLNKIERLHKSISEKVKNSLDRGIYLPYYQLPSIFRLNSFELDTILICLAIELNTKYEKLYAYLQDDVTKKNPSVDLVLDLLSSTDEQRINLRTFFHTQSPLLKYSLIQIIDDNQPKSFLSKCLKIDDRVANFLLGFNFLDSRLDSFSRIINPARSWADVIIDDLLKEGLVRLSEEYFKKKLSKKLIFYLCGPYGAGKKLVAEAFCQKLKIPLIIADAREILNTDQDFEKAVKLLFREAVLQPAAIFLEHFDQLISNDGKHIHFKNTLFKIIEEISFVTFLSGEMPWSPKAELKKHAFIKIEFPIPAYSMRKCLWELAVHNQFPPSLDVNIDALANKFRFTGGQIENAVADATNSTLMQSLNNNGQVDMEDLYRSCRAQSNQKLSEMARKITPKYTWNDIVLPPDKFQQLKEICGYVKYRPLVYQDWGFDRKLSLGKGLNILFLGPSGTGKTMAAEIIAYELKLDLYKIDLSSVVSKYIGETEKNLNKIFKESETSNSILFFDEADALFGKRSEVRDSHDRYANIEINYLLQKMEEHEGIAVLASNFRKNIDEAFTRRMHFSVDFPFPDEEYRLRIWRNIFPEETPTSKDIDLKFLAKSFKISGGNIKNIALNAAFLAAEDSKEVKMKHIVQAAKREHQKMGKLCSQSEFGEYYSLIITKKK